MHIEKIVFWSGLTLIPGNVALFTEDEEESVSINTFFFV